MTRSAWQDKQEKLLKDLERRITDGWEKLGFPSEEYVEYYCESKQRFMDPVSPTGLKPLAFMLGFQ
jgi:hypothetical protein